MTIIIEEVATGGSSIPIGFPLVFTVKYATTLVSRFSYEGPGFGIWHR